MIQVWDVWDDSLTLLQEHCNRNDPYPIERWVHTVRSEAGILQRRPNFLPGHALNRYIPQEMVVVFEREDQHPLQIGTQAIGVCDEWLVANVYHQSKW